LLATGREDLVVFFLARQLNPSKWCETRIPARRVTDMVGMVSDTDLCQVGLSAKSVTDERPTNAPTTEGKRRRRGGLRALRQMKLTFEIDPTEVVMAPAEQAPDLGREWRRRESNPRNRC
jgi:hypothetical protein